MSDLHCHNCQHEGPFGSSLTGPYCLQCGGLNIWPKTLPPGPRAVPRTGTHPLWKSTAGCSNDCPAHAETLEAKLNAFQDALSPIVEGGDEAWWRELGIEVPDEEGDGA